MRLPVNIVSGGGSGSVAHGVSTRVSTRQSTVQQSNQRQQQPQPQLYSAAPQRGHTHPRNGRKNVSTSATATSLTAEPAQKALDRSLQGYPHLSGTDIFSHTLPLHLSNVPSAALLVPQSPLSAHAQPAPSSLPSPASSSSIRLHPGKQPAQQQLAGLPVELLSLADPEQPVSLPVPGAVEAGQLDNSKLDKLVTTLSRHRGTWRRVLLLYEWLKGCGHTLDDRLCTTLIRVCADHGDAVAALSVYEWMRAPQAAGGAQLQPTAYTYMAAMRAALGAGMTDRAMQVWKDVQAARLVPDCRLCMTYIEAAAKMGATDQALHMYAQMRAAPPNSPMAPTVHVYTAAMRAATEGGAWRQALGIWEDMQAAGCPPTAHAFAAAISACAAGADWQRAVRLFDSMTRAGGIRPDVVSCTALVSALAAAAQADKAEAVVHWMLDIGLKPNVRTYTALLSAMGSAQRWLRAVQLLFLMQQPEYGAVAPNAYTYSTLLKYLGEAGQWEMAETLFGLLEEHQAQVQQAGQQGQQGQLGLGLQAGQQGQQGQQGQLGLQAGQQGQQGQLGLQAGQQGQQGQQGQLGLGLPAAVATTPVTGLVSGSAPAARVKGGWAGSERDVEAGAGPSGSSAQPTTAKASVLPLAPHLQPRLIEVALRAEQGLPAPSPPPASLTLTPPPPSLSTHPPPNASHLPHPQQSLGHASYQGTGAAAGLTHSLGHTDLLRSDQQQGRDQQQGQAREQQGQSMQGKQQRSLTAVQAGDEESGSSTWLHPSQLHGLDLELHKQAPFLAAPGPACPALPAAHPLPTPTPSHPLAASTGLTSLAPTLASFSTPVSPSPVPALPPLSPWQPPQQQQGEVDWSCGPTSWTPQVPATPSPAPGPPAAVTTATTISLPPPPPPLLLPASLSFDPVADQAPLHPPTPHSTPNPPAPRHLSPRRLTASATPPARPAPLPSFSLFSHDPSSSASKPHTAAAGGSMAAVAPVSLRSKPSPLPSPACPPSCPPLVNEVVCGAVMLAYERAGKWQEAAGVLDRARALGVTPSTVMFNTAISAAARAGRMEVAEQLLAMMPAKDLVTIKTMAAGYGLAGRPMQVEAMLQLLPALGQRPCEHCYCALITAHSLAGDTQAALRLRQRMAREGVVATLAVYNTLLAACERGGETQAGLELLQAMKREGMQPNALTQRLMASLGQMGVQAVQREQVAAAALSAVFAAAGSVMMRVGMF